MCIKVDRIKGKGRSLIATDDISEDIEVTRSPIIKIKYNNSHSILKILDEAGIGRYLFHNTSRSLNLACGFISFCNHATYPNADIEIINNHYVLYSLRPISKGEEITINYLGPPGTKGSLQDLGFEEKE